jgi:hypothetical protein
MEPIYTAYNTPGNVNIQIDDEAKAQLKTIATWAQILAIIELASAGLSLVVSVYSALRYSSVMGLMGWTMVGSLFGVAIQVILASMLLRFSTRTSRALLTEDQEELTMAFTNLKTYFKTFGIFIIIAFSLVVLALVVTLTFSAAFR